MRNGASAGIVGSGSNRSNRKKHFELAAGAFALGLAAAYPSAIHAQSAAAQHTAASADSFNIRSQNLGAALAAFADRARLKLLFPSHLVSGRTSAGLHGSYTREQALNALLSGTGLSYSFTNTSTITVFDPRMGAAFGAMPDGTAPLDVIDVVDASGIRASEDLPYQTPGSVSYISEETIQRFRGTSPGDIFRGVPGVLSSDVRNGNGIDINIRGLQGVGRVPVTIDGAMNSTTAYQGYQGVGNRTYVDPDLIGGISIENGPSNGPVGGIGGTVSMRTIGVDDVIKPGQNFGIRFRGGIGTNSGDVPKLGTIGGFGPVGSHTRPPPAPSVTGMDRPGLLEPTDVNGSVALGAKTENIDVVAAFARRVTGNYYAGTHGRAGASSGNVGPVQTCQDYVSTVFCTNNPNYYVNTGLTVYRPGEQVLNSSADTTSGLLKTTIRLNDDHTVEFGYLGFRSEHGEVRSSEVGDNFSPAYQRWLSTVSTDTGTIRYRWNPSDNDLIDLKWNSWGTWLESRVPTTGTTGKLAELGLPPPGTARTLVGSNTRMLGTDISNTSRFLTPMGRVSWNYGVSYLRESTAPTDLTMFLEEFKPRDGAREETAVFTKVDWEPLRWLKLNAGARYQNFQTTDTGEPSKVIGTLEGQTKSRSGDGISPTVGVTVTPIEGWQVYALYKEGLRTPSLMESVGAYALYVDPNIRPEHARTWEYGTNVMRDGLFATGDKARFKISYFNTHVDDYISRLTVPYPSPVLYYLVAKNIAAAKFSGIELSSRYEVNGFSVEGSSNYYTNVEFCPTADICTNTSLPADYAANHIPPKYMASLTVAQKFFHDTLTVGARVSHVGPRSAKTGASVQGAATLVAPIAWDPYTLVDAFVTYNLSKDISLELAADNLTDVYYVNPLSNGYMPAPGRTVRMSMTAKF